MEDDKIKGLFEGFAPQLSSDSQFLDKLQRELDGVEFVKQSMLRLSVATAGHWWLQP